MRVLLDECVDRRLSREISGHDVKTVPEVGWAADQNLPFQQDLASFPVAVIVMRASTTRLSDLRRLIPKLLAVLPAAKRGEVTWVGI